MMTRMTPACFKANNIALPRIRNASYTVFSVHGTRLTMDAMVARLAALEAGDADSSAQAHQQSQQQDAPAAQQLEQRAQQLEQQPEFNVWPPRQLQLILCGAALEGFITLSFLPEHTESLHALCRYIERKLDLASVQRLEVLDARAGRYVPLGSAAELVDRATVRVVAAAEGQRGWDAPSRRPFPYTLHQAAQDGDAESAMALLKAGVDPDERQYGLARVGRTVLHAAARQPRADLVQAIVHGAQAPPDLLVIDRLGRSALHVAATHGNPEVAAALLAGAPELLRGTTTSGATPLHEACYHGHASVVDVLCRAHADINAVDGVGRLPLHWAAERGHAAASAMLMSHALRMKHSLDPVNATDQLRRSSLHLACINGHPDVAAVLVAHGADVNAIDQVGQSPMELAGMNNDSARDPTRGDGEQGSNAILGFDRSAPARTGRLHEAPIAAPPRGRTPANVGRQRTDVTHDPRHARQEHPDTIAGRGHLGCVTLLLTAGARAPGGA